MTDVANPTADKLYQYPRWITRTSSAFGTPPIPIPVADLATLFSATRVVQSAGGATLDSAQLQWMLTSSLINRQQTTNFATLVEVWTPGTTARLHLGDYVTESESVNQGGERLTAQSHLRKWHFGTPWFGQLWHDPRTGTDVSVSYPPIFNPVIDGKVLGNKSNKLRLDNGRAFIWCHAEQLVTSTAETYAGQKAEKWTLATAVASVCWQMNGAESYIDNPTDVSLAKLSTAVEMNAVTLGFDLSLPKILDQLCHPLGFNWFIDYELAKPRIEFFEVGNGPKKQLLFQAPNSSLDLTASNVNDYSVTRMIGDAPNQVLVIGDYERREITLPLYRVWPVDDDSLTAEDLTINETSEYKDKPVPWRMWVANEAGDYKDTRPEIGLPPDLSSVFKNFVPHRRNIEDPITYGGQTGIDTQRRQILLEWSKDGGTTWEVVPPSFGQPAILPDQIGVLFTGDTPPPEMINAGDDARLRITGVVQGDHRIEYLAAALPNAVNGRANTLTLDVADKFQDRRVQLEGDFASALVGSPLGADEANDTAIMIGYGNTVRDQYSCAELDCRFVLPGIHLDYKIGDQITKIAGREIDLNMCVSPKERYPQIIRREFSYVNGPQTILTVDRTTGRNPKPPTPKTPKLQNPGFDIRNQRQA